MTKRNKIIYWIATVWLSLGLLSGAIFQLMRMEDAVKNFTHLGYPLYLLTILGIWKILGAAAILVPKLPLVKEWAYAGIFFTMTGAFISHLIMGDTMAETFPSVLTLIIAAVSWYFRPAERKIISAN
jgi:DoxX-like family